QAEGGETARGHGSRGLSVHHDGDGMVVVRGRLTPEVGAVLMKALAAAGEMLYQRERNDAATGGGASTSTERPSLAQRQADALALHAETALHHGVDPGTAGGRHQGGGQGDGPGPTGGHAAGECVPERGDRASPTTAAAP